MAAAEGPRFKPVADYPSPVGRVVHKRDAKTPAVAIVGPSAPPPAPSSGPAVRAYAVKVAGAVTDWEYHWMRMLAQQAVSTDPATVTLEVVEMLPVDWEGYLIAEKRRLGGLAYGHKSTAALVLIDDEYVGDSAAVQKWFASTLQIRNARPFALYVAMGKTLWKKYLSSSGLSYCFMDVRIGDDASVPPSRLTFELYDLHAPKSCQNFRALCAGTTGGGGGGGGDGAAGSAAGPMGYVGSLFHRVVPGGWIQGGDVSEGSPGDGGASVFAPTFEDESFAVAHDRVGILGMCNAGAHTNGSQFYVTLQAMPAFDRAFVAFGRLIDGLDAATAIAALPTLNQRPLVPVTVVASGPLEL